MNHARRQRQCRPRAALARYQLKRKVIGPLPDNETYGWKQIIKSSSDKHFGFDAAATTTIRRNVMLDDNNQRYQLSLSIKDLSYFKGYLDVQIVLLGMEEGEVEDSGGFPAIVMEDDSDADAMLIRHENSSYVEFSCKIINDHVHNNDYSKKDRKRISYNGYGWCFKRDLNEFYDCKNATFEVAFHHIDTGAKMELRLPPDDTSKNDYYGNSSLDSDCPT